MLALPVLSGMRHGRYGTEWTAHDASRGKAYAAFSFGALAAAERIMKLIGDYPSDKDVMRLLAMIGHVRLARLLDVPADTIALQLAPHVLEKPLPDPASMYRNNLQGRDV